MPLLQTFGEDSARDFGFADGNNLNTNSIPPLYPFNINTTLTFTAGTATGQNGPNLSQALSGLTSNASTSWASNTAFFNMTQNGYQLWTVPATGLYQIKAFGAPGASTNLVVGAGAIIQATVRLVQSGIVTILVGQYG